MDALVGFVTLNDVNKIRELQMAYMVIAFGGLLSFGYSFVRHDAKVLPVKADGSNQVILFAVIASAFLWMLSQIGKVGLIASIASISLAWIAIEKYQYFRDGKKRLVLFILIPFVLLVTKGITSTQYTPAVLVLFSFFLLLLWRAGAEAFALAVLVFYTKSFFAGPFVVVDTFHSAEHFLSSLEWKRGFYTVFPNLGYLEETPAYFLTNLIKNVTGEMVQMSIATSRSLIAVALLLYIFSIIVKRNRLLAVLFMIAVPTDRVSLLMALAYTLALIGRFDDKEIQQPDLPRVVLLSLFPLIALGLSPSYVLLPILGLVTSFPVKMNRKEILFIGGVWVAIFFLLLAKFKKYFAIYSEFSKLYEIAYSTSISILSPIEVIFWCALLLGASAILYGSIRCSDSLKIKVLKAIVVTIVLMQCARYGFGRIDPGYTRLVGMVTALILVSSFNIIRYHRIITLLLAFIIVAYIQFEVPRGIVASDFSTNNSIHAPVQLSVENEQLAKRIEGYAAGRKVINYSMEPALSLGISNIIVAPFTSPYVTLGVRNQNAIIDLMKQYPDAIVYLGHQFTTFDGVDVRLRTPLVFRYLAHSYQYVSDSGNMYAVPNHEAPDEAGRNVFFGYLDMKRSPIYFTDHAQGRFTYRTIMINCPREETGFYTITNDGNILVGNFKCGANLVPEVFFVGNTKSVNRT